MLDLCLTGNNPGAGGHEGCILADQQTVNPTFAQAQNMGLPEPLFILASGLAELIFDSVAQRVWRDDFNLHTVFEDIHQEFAVV